MQHGSGVGMGDSNADTNEEDEDKMEESNIDHNQMHTPVCNVWDEPHGDEVREFLIITEELSDILNHIMNLRKVYCKALPQLKEIIGKKFKDVLKSYAWLEVTVYDFHWTQHHLVG